MTLAPENDSILIMALITSQKIASLYERYKAIDVTFSKEMIQVSGLVANQVYLKCVGDFWPCVIYSSSFQGVKIVANIKSGILGKLEFSNNMVSLRYCFKVADKANPVAFFVNAKCAGYTSYGNSKDVALFTLIFTQRPPDDLIEIMGRILDANVASAKRREERILITPDSIRKLGISSKDTAVFIQGVPRNCILRDISFSGAKLIMMGVAKFLDNKEAALRIDFEDPRECFLLKGKFIRSETVEGRKELVALIILFDETVTPMGYKIRLNDFLSQVRADRSGEAADAPPKPAAQPGALPAAKPEQAAKLEQAAAPKQEQSASSEEALGDENFELPEAKG